jgi:hypothetical protein
MRCEERVVNERGSRRLAVAEVLDVAVGAEADVVGEVPANVVGIFEDGDLVSGPVPIVAKGVISRRDAEIEAAEPETRPIAAGDTPNVAAAEAAGEVAVLPGMIEVIVRIILAGVVADPLAVGVDVRSFGMALFVGVFYRRRLFAVRCVVRSLVRNSLGGRRAFTRYVAVTDVFGLWRGMPSTFFLRESWNRTDQE